MFNKRRRILAVMMFLLIVFQSLPLNAIAEIVTDSTELNSSASIEKKKLDINEYLSKSQELYNRTKTELDSKQKKKNAYINCETDASVVNATAEVSPADSSLNIKGRSVYDEGAVISIVLKDDLGNIMYTTSGKSGDCGSFNISVPTKNIKCSKYKVVVKSMKKTSNTLQNKSLFENLSVSDGVYGQINQVSNDGAFSTTITRSASVSNVEQESMSFTMMNASVGGVEVLSPRFLSSTDDPEQPLTELEFGSNVYFKIGIKNSDPNVINGTMYIRLYNITNDIIKESSTQISIPYGTSFSPYTASMILPTESSSLTSLEGCYVTAEVLDYGNSMLMTDTYRFPLTVPGNLDGKITFSMSSSQLNGDKIILTWDEVPGVEKYYIYRRAEDQIMWQCITPSGLTSNQFVGGYSADIPEDAKVYMFSVVASSGDYNTEPSAPIKVARGQININTSSNLDYNSIFEKVKINIDSGTFSLNGKVLKTYGLFEVLNSSTFNVGGGKLFVMNNGDFMMSGSSKLIMNNSDDYISVEGCFTMQTSTPHGTNDLNNGKIVVYKDFKNVSSNFLPAGSHEVALLGRNKQTVNFGTSGKSSRCFNILSYNKPFLTGYAWNNVRSTPEIPSNWCNIANDINLYAEKYNGIDGVYPATGGFSRTYTDMSLDSPGFDLTISRTYNSSSVFKEPRRGWTMGKGWSFSYEGSIEDEEPAPSGSASPTPTPVPSPSSSPIVKTKNVRLPDGQTLKFSFNAGTTTYTAVDSRAELTKSDDIYTLTMKDKTKYLFTQGDASNAWLTAIVDIYGNTTTIEVDINGKVDKIKDQTGRCFKVVYDDLNAKNRIVAIKDYLSDDANANCVRKVEYAYNSSGLLSEARDTLELASNDNKGNLVYKYEYDCLDYLAKISDGYGKRFESVEYVMETSGKVKRIVDAFGKSSEYIYTNGRTTLEERDLENNVRTTQYDYDQTLALTTTTFPDGKTHIVEYETYNTGKNIYNEEKSITDREGNKTVYVRDSGTGNVISVSNPDLTTKTYGYYTKYDFTDENDPRKNLLKWEKDEVGNYTYYEYDSACQLVNQYVYRKKIPEVTLTPMPSPGNTSNFVKTTYEYYLMNEKSYKGGLLKAVTTICNDSSSSRTEYYYTNQGNLEKVKDGDNKEIEYQYDDIRKPNIIKKKYKTDSNNNAVYAVTEDSYDKNGRLVKSEQYSSDSVSIKNTTRYVYDIMGRLTQKVMPNNYDSSCDEFVSGNNYNEYTDKNVGYRYTYYGSTNLYSRYIDPEGNATLYHKYDVYGNLLTEQKPPNNPSDLDSPQSTVYSYTYDNMNRPKEIYYSSESDYITNSDGSVTMLTKNKLEEYDYSTTNENEKVSEGNYLTLKKHKKYFNSTDYAETVYRSDYSGKNVKTVFEPGTADETVTETEYYENGNVKSTKDALGYKTYYSYGYENETNALGKRVEHVFTPCESSNGNVSSYTYKRTIYDDSGNVRYEYVRKEKVASNSANSYKPANQATIESEAASNSNYYSSSYLYYLNGKILESTGVDYKHSKYYYGLDGNLVKQEDFTDSSSKITTEYAYNFIGKPETKIIHVRKGDIESNDYNDNMDVTYEYSYMYDSNGNNTGVHEPFSGTQPYSSKFYYYDNLDRMCAKGMSTIFLSYTSYFPLNWAGNPISQSEYGDVNTTYYYYNWKGLAAETKKVVNVWTGSSDVELDCIAQSEYDFAGRKIVEVSPKYKYAGSLKSAPTRFEYTYDKFDRVKFKKYYGTEKKVNTSTWGWNDTASAYKTLNSYEYDKNGNMIKETDGDNYSIEYKYYPDGKLERKLEQVNKDRKLPYTVKYSYDTLGRTAKETSVKNETDGVTILTDDEARGIEKTYTYETKNNTSGFVDGTIVKTDITSCDSFTGVSGTVEKVTSDLMGNVVKYEQYRDGSTINTTEYTYNSFNKVSKKTIYFKDLNDSLSALVDKTGTTICQYNALGYLVYSQNYMDTPTITTDDIIEKYDYDFKQMVTAYTKRNFSSSECSIKYKNYSANGNLMSESDGRDNYTYYEYDQRNKLKNKKVTINNVLHETQKRYDKNGNLIREAEVIGGNIFDLFTYTYDKLDRVIEKTDNSDSANPVALEKIEYNNRGLQNKSYKVYESSLTGSPTYILTTYTYDNNGRLTDTVEDPTGINRTIKQSYDNHGNVNAKYDGKNNKTSLKYDCMNRLRQVTNPKGESINYEYDYAGNMLKQEKNYMDFDNIGQQQVRSNLYEYNSLNKLVRKIDNGGRSGSPGSYTYTSGKYEAYNYYADGSLKNKKDRNAVLTNYSYYALGYIKEQVAGGVGGITLSYTYDNSGNPLSVKAKNPNNTTSMEETIREYDALGRVTKKMQKKDSDTTPYITTDYTYDIITTDGLLAEKAVDSKGNTTSKIYDKSGRLKYAVDGPETSTNRTEYEYYKNGSRKRVKYTASTTEEYTYYADNKLNILTNKVNGTEIGIYTYTYDAAGNQKSKKEQQNSQDTGKTTSYYYDELNRLKEIKEPANAQGNVMTTIYTYDVEGNRKTETVKLGTTKTVKVYSYNDQNRIKDIKTYTTEYLSDMTWVSATNGSGSVQVDKSNAGNTITLNGVQYEKGLGAHASSEIVYNLSGNYTRFMADIGIDDEITTTDAKAKFLVYAGTSLIYDSGEMTCTSPTKSIMLDVSGKSQLKIVLDSVGVITNDHADWADARLVGTPPTTPVPNKYDNNGNLTEETRGGATYTNTYNKLNQLTQTSVVQSGQTTTINNTYNGDGYRVKQSVTKNGTTTTKRYVYEQDKVVLELNDQGSQISRNIYGLNLLKRTTGGLSYYYMYNGHGDVVALIDLSTPANLAAGKTITGSVAITNPTYATDGAANTSQYSLIGQNLQWVKLDLGQSQYIDKIKLWRYFYDARSYHDVIIQVSNDVNFASGVKTVFNNDMNNSASQGTGTDSEYAESSNGKEVSFAPTYARYVRVWSNGSGVNTNNHIVELQVFKSCVVMTYSYDSFGNIVEQNGNVDNNITYAGYQYDKDTGLYYLNARMYDPLTARFLQEDTYAGEIDDPLSLNLYTYCHNEPLMYIDPTGHWAEGDSDRDVAVQMALLQLTDNWYKAKATNDIAGMNNATNIAKEVRKQGLKHSIVQAIIDQFIPSKKQDLTSGDSARIIENNQRAIGKQILGSFNVVNKSLEKAAFYDGKISADEWTRMRNISHNLLYIRGTTVSPRVDPYDVSNDYNAVKPSVVDKVRKSAYITANEGLLKAGVWKDAATMLLHFLSNKGTPMQIDFGRMIIDSKDVSNRAELDVQRFINAAKDFAIEGETVSIVSIMDSPADRNSDKNWIAAVGAYTTWGQGTVIKNGNTIKTKFMYNMRDTYDWHNLKDGQIQFLKGAQVEVLGKKIGMGVIPNTWLNKMHKAGIAREFYTYGNEGYDISWSSSGYLSIIPAPPTGKLPYEIK